ncbi:MAG: hypothetical protein OEY87_08020 [Gammaproteobacteria bacterium]|nr:hypothetical protein [Gammaproteobacteria bacterium]
MRADTYLLTFVIAAGILFSTSVIAADKELRQQRAAAQKEQSLQIKERSELIKDAERSFKEVIKEINNENRERIAELETEFNLTQVDLNAAHETRVASAESDHQKKLMDLFMDPSGKFDEQKLQQMEVDFKKHSDELFALKKQSAEEIHRATVKHIANKNKIYDEGDHSILKQASTLGLTNEYSPILITPAGGALTRQEERLNEKEKKNVVKIKQANMKLLSRYRNGKELREWEIQNIEEDFKILWEENAELHDLDSQQMLYNNLLMGAFQGKAFNHQDLTEKIAENNKKKSMITIEYKKIRDKNRIKRNNEKKEILSK